MVNYNTTFMGTANNIADIFNGVSNMTGEGLGIAIVTLVFIVGFASAKTFDTNIRFILSSFLTTVIAGLFFFMGMLQWWVAVLPTILLLISVVIEFFKR